MRPSCQPVLRATRRRSWLVLLIGSTTLSQIPVVAVTSEPNLDAADRNALAKLLGQLEKVPTVTSAHYLSTSPDGRAAELLVVSSVSNDNESKDAALVNQLNLTITRASLPTDLKVHLAGAVATNVAGQEKSANQGNEIQDFSILFIIVLLLIIFRSVLAPIVTLVPAALVLVLSSSFIGALGSAGVLKVSFFTEILLIVLILGAGTDYGLFLVFRVREHLLAGADPKDAVAHAVRRVGASITGSAATVIVALLTLLVASFGLYHDLGLPLAIGIATMLLAGLTLLPALLAIFGRAVFWPTKTIPRGRAEGVWERVAARLVRRPGWTLTVGVLVLGALSLFALGFRATGFGGDVSAPVGSSVALGNADLATYFPQSNANPTNIVMYFPKSVWEDSGQLAIANKGLHDGRVFTAITGPLVPNGASLTSAELSSIYYRIHRYGSAQELVNNAPGSAHGIGSLDGRVRHLPGDRPLYQR